MAPYSILITGANRGIGLGLVKHFLKDKDIHHVIATARDPSKAKELNEITDKRLTVLKLDVNSDDSIRNLYSQVEKIVGEHGLTVLVNNAGIYLKYHTNQKPSRADLIKNFDTNAAGVLVLTQTFLPLIRKAAGKVRTDEYSINRAAIINISSDLGTISNNTMGSGEIGTLAYRASKNLSNMLRWPGNKVTKHFQSALNSITKTMSIDLAPEHILVALLCPGWVKTDMGGPNAQITVEQSMDQLIPSIYKLKKEHDGGYFNRDLTRIPF
ncbi:oxidoreductase, short chain dehydrogenase/reductase family protein [Oesophagostomum dentatum]|uniref:Oxidoreductase, short chain dehydrogenase/reductase family protein n=1 Tax=Oesophagostomum dentatum TaxID=61180 RepID=A0A0B1THU9_OESDE|nr:oxidoreductase, short chain dehydrogenase/reductase family protein [Oesophagostomum dentatum]